MASEWELFTAKGQFARGGVRQGCFVTVSTHNLLLLSSAAMAALGEPEAVQLLWDARRRRVGLRKTEVGTEAAYKIHRNNRRGRNGSFTCGKFLRHHGLTIRPGRRPATIEGDILAFEISAPGG